jgi:uncharacterized membrane protein
MSTEANLIIIGTTLFWVGVAYAWYVARRPPRPGLTWLWVVGGCAFTNVAVSLIVWELTRHPFATLSCWAAYGISGLPMILGQIVKDSNHHQEAMGYMEEMRRNNGD